MGRGQPSSDDAGRPREQGVAWALAGALVSCFVLQCVTGMAWQSATYDEPVYVAAGYSYVETGDFRLKRDAPPLVATLSGLVLELGTHFGNPVPFDATSTLWNGSTEYAFAEQFLAGVKDRQRTLLLARIPVVLIGAALAWYVFLAGRLLLGDVLALLPLALLCFDPNLVAHARVVSCDVALAAFFFVAHHYLYRLLTEPGPGNLLGLSLAAALATLAKFTGLLVFPSLALVAGLAFAFPGLLPLYPWAGDASQRRRRVRRIGLQAALASAAATLLLVSLLYRSWTGLAEYAAGLRTVYANAAPGYQFYLLGHFAPHSFWYYYPVAMLLKTPEHTLVLLALAALAACIPGTRPARGFWLLVPVALVLLVCSRDPANLGLRRVLLVYPFLFLWIGERFAALRERGSRPRERRLGVRLIEVGVGLLVAAGILSAVLAHPHQLAYFNRFVGGPARGYLYLDDSNLDWGQDLPGLAAWQAEHGVRPLALWYFGTDAPAAYGIDWRPVADDELLRPRRAVYAISVNRLIGLKLAARQRGQPQLDWLVRYRPATRIGHSIFIYDFR
ncbi:MAG TPA: glycosyltransferase family 39 protein [Vicinamibacteria bacterium]|nr:glycosyltransferase family 39 protein [Vicinamibacteria bacterium]